MVSKASDDLPEPDRPVTTINRSRGRSRSRFLRLWVRAPRMRIWLMAGESRGRNTTEMGRIRHYNKASRPDGTGLACPAPGAVRTVGQSRHCPVWQPAAGRIPGGRIPRRFPFRRLLIMPSVYDIKPRFQALLRPLVRRLAAAGTTANQVTVVAMLASLAVGLLV